MNKQRVLAIIMLLITVSSWGGMFHIAKTTLEVIDAFWLALIRYSFTAVIFCLILYWREGLLALRFDGKLMITWWYGTLGFAMFNFFVFFGLSYSLPVHGAVIMALMPLITALVNWVSVGERPPGYTLLAIAVAFIGVVFVITRGDITNLFHNESVLGDGLMLLGSISWVLYTRSASRFSDWSSLRFTTLSTLTGSISIVFITGIFTLFNIAQMPSLTILTEQSANIIYIIGPATIIAVLFWNQAIRVIGVINGMLFINLVPITALVLGLIGGNKLHSAELAGVTIAVAALIANNIVARQRTA